MITLFTTELKEVRDTYRGYRIIFTEIQNDNYIIGVFKSGRKVKYYVNHDEMVVEIFEELKESKK